MSLPQKMRSFRDKFKVRAEAKADEFIKNVKPEKKDKSKSSKVEDNKPKKNKNEKTKK
uniref:Uncharacterized protein n=1 Tax=viral metagenome TaxID=1070528 RepID=A0A6H2A012_9ZZZZ